MTRLSQAEGLSDAGEIIALSEALHEPKRFTVPVALADEDRAVELIAAPAGVTLHSLSPYFEAVLDQPRRRKGTDTVRDLASLLTLTARHLDETSTVVFANPNREKPTIRTVFDYHPHTSDLREANWREHQVVYTAELAEEWKQWTKVHKQWLSQEQFAELVEERLADVVMPDPAQYKEANAVAQQLGMTYATPAELVQLSRGLQVNVGVKVRSAITTQTGETALQFETTHEATRGGAGFQVPGLLLIAIPVFFGGVRWALPVRLRYRMAEGTIIWSLVLYRHEICFDSAFNGMVDHVREVTKLPVVIGHLGAA